jgi:hypothetical protein
VPSESMIKVTYFLLMEHHRQSHVKSLYSSNNRDVTISTTANRHYKRALDLIIDTKVTRFLLSKRENHTILFLSFVLSTFKIK